MGERILVVGENGSLEWAISQPVPPISVSVSDHNPHTCHRCSAPIGYTTSSLVEISNGTGIAVTKHHESHYDEKKGEVVHYVVRSERSFPRKVRVRVCGDCLTTSDKVIP